MQTSSKFGAVLLAANLCGCAGALSAATEAASKASGCPKDQIAAQPTTLPPPVPPPEIAASPKRYAVWRRNLPNPKEHPAFVATGCGHTLRFVCGYELHNQPDGTPFFQWDCNQDGETSAAAPAPSAIPPSASAAPAVVQGPADANTLSVLDALAVQLAAQGNAAAAAQIRLKAQELRSVPSPSPSASAPPPPAP
jgi:hypothetical protein